MEFVLSRDQVLALALMMREGETVVACSMTSSGTPTVKVNHPMGGQRVLDWGACKDTAGRDIAIWYQKR